MKNRLLAHASKLLLGVICLGSLGLNCPRPVQRPSGSTDGTARWAWAIANPLVASYSADAELREILGAEIFLDGRLPANTGSWSFVTYSPSRSKIFQVTVAADGHASTSERDQAAPGPGIVRPLPSTWADSTAVLAATSGHRDGGASVAQLAVCNLNAYAQAPNQAVWAINFNAGPNQLVRVDGTYIGPQ